jgi:hypothetical protein
MRCKGMDRSIAILLVQLDRAICVSIVNGVFGIFQMILYSAALLLLMVERQTDWTVDPV